MYPRWFALAILITLAAPRPVAQSNDERAIQDLAQRFFNAYAGHDPSAIPAIVSARSPHHAQLVALGTAPAAAAESAVDAQIKVGRIRIAGSRATAHVLVEIGVTGSTSATAAERLLLCTREGDRWQVWSLAPSLAELVDNVTSASSRDARVAMVGPDGAWLGADLWPELVARGDRLFQRGRYQDARNVYEAAVEMAEAAGDNTGLAVGVRGLGHVRLYAGDLDAALGAYERSLAIARASDLDREIFRALNGIGNVRAALKQSESALRAYDESLRIAEAGADQAGIALVLNNIANIEFARGHYDVALARYQRALAIKERVGDAAAISIGAYNIGRVLFLQGKYADALAYQKRSLALAQELDRKAGVASIHRSLGEIHERLQDQGRAMHHYRSSLDVAVQIGDRATAVDDLLAIARVWRIRGEGGLAIESLQRATPLIDEQGASARRARAFEQLGLIHQARGSLTAARQAVETARQLFVELGDHAAVADSLRQLGSISVRETRLDEGQTRLDGSLAAARSAGDGRRIVAALTAMARLHALRGEHALALATARDGLEIARRIRGADGAIVLEQAAGRAYAALGRGEEARQAFDRAIELFEEPRQSDGEVSPADEVLDTRSPHADAAELMVGRQRFAEAWTYVERGRASELSRLFPSSSRKPARGPRRRSADPSATIGYLVSDRQVDLFVFPARRDRELGPARHVTVKVDRETLAQAIARHRGALEQRQPSRDSSELYRLLIAPVARELRSTRSLRIVPDGALWDLPFESLQRTDGRFLIQTHSVSYSLFATSAQFGDGEPRPTAPARTLLAIGRDDPVSTSHSWLMSLAPDGHVQSVDAGAEVRQVSAAYEPSRRLTVAGEMATESTVANAAREARVLHFAAVVRMDDFDPMHSGPLLSPAPADDGVLTPDDVATLRLAADVVVLPSVWSTPRSGGAGRALQTQSWAWRLAGCPNLLVGRWSAGQAARADVLDALHRALARSSDARHAHDRAADALRRVQLAWLSRDRAASPRWTGIALVSVD